MYVIGINDFYFIKITHKNTLYNGRKLWCEIANLEYNAPLDKATIINDYDKAEELLKEIQDNVENIKFSNNSVIGEILDREHSFDKVAYSKELKIYELVPVAYSRKETNHESN